MANSIVINGMVTREGRLELEDNVPLPEGPVRVTVETVSPAAAKEQARSPLYLTEEEWMQRKAAMNEAIGCLSDEEAARILEVVEREFEQVNPDDWR